jgi:hypothetical protein
MFFPCKFAQICNIYIYLPKGKVDLNHPPFFDGWIFVLDTNLEPYTNKDSHN